MTENKPNIPLLRKAVEWVEAQEALPLIDRQWYQGLWIQNALERSYELAYERDPRGYRSPAQTTEEYDRQRKVVEHVCGTTYCVAGYIAQLHNDDFIDSRLGRVNGFLIGSDVYATELLGITSEQAERLFHASNTAARVRSIAEEIAGEKL